MTPVAAAVRVLLEMSKASRILITGLLASLLVPLAGSGATLFDGVRIQSTTVNPNRSVTINWVFENEDVYNDQLSVDGSVVRKWSGLSQQTTYTTKPLLAGPHRVTIAVVEIFYSNTDYASAACSITTNPDYIWICAWDWSASKQVVIPSSPRSSFCVVPNVTGLRLADARARIRAAKCSVGLVTRVQSARGAGTVLGQRPKAGTKLPKGALVDLRVSDGPSA